MLPGCHHALPPNSSQWCECSGSLQAPFRSVVRWVLFLMVLLVHITHCPRWQGAEWMICNCGPMNSRSVGDFFVCLWSLDKIWINTILVFLHLPHLAEYFIQSNIQCRQNKLQQMDIKDFAQGWKSSSLMVLGFEFTTFWSVAQHQMKLVRFSTVLSDSVIRHILTTCVYFY